MTDSPTSAPRPAAGSAPRTLPPAAGRPVVLYDGGCRICTRSALGLQRLVGPSRLDAQSFQEPGVLARYPGVDYDACMRRMHLVLVDGRVVQGAEAVALSMAVVPVAGALARLYYLPLVRPLSEAMYDWIAANRYRLFGRTGEACDPQGTCALHVRDDVGAAPRRAANDVRS